MVAPEVAQSKRVLTYDRHGHSQSERPERPERIRSLIAHESPLVGQFVEEVAFGPGAWDQLPSRVQQTFITNASTFLDEAGEPDALAPQYRGVSEASI